MPELSCWSCGSVLTATAKFCSECGKPRTQNAQSAEYKQVTVLFADVVHSMDLAAALGPERLRELMAALLDRSTEVVRRYGGIVDKFTGDGIMALFGAPVALEDHAFRACLAAVEIQKQTEYLAAEVVERDGITLQLRVGLNSGQVIAGEIGSDRPSYTAVGEQVGMAQRMESVAPPGGVMLSESTARLVADAVVLAEPELVQIKGSDVPVAARRLTAIAGHQPRARGESPLIARTWELNTITAILDEAMAGAGCVVNVRGPRGNRQEPTRARIRPQSQPSRGVPVFATYCESHTGDIPFHVVAQLLRGGLEINDLDHAEARSRIRDRFPAADPEDLVLFEDLLAVRDANVALPNIAADARRRRLTALVNAASLERREPAVYVIEDAHWIDEASESLLAEFLAVIPQTPSLVLVTYRPEYTGALAQAADAQTMALRPLNEAQASALATELLGADPSIDRLAELVISRAAGNPFFAEEMVRDLAERGVLQGESGAYLLRGDVEDTSVPATLQATIGARIDRLDAAAKRTLTAAAVIGSRFDTDLLGVLIEDADLMPLINAQLVNQVSFGARPEYAFRHPMIRTVAYESQLRSARAQLHRRLAAAIERRGVGRGKRGADRRAPRGGGGPARRFQPGTCVPATGRPTATSTPRTSAGAGPSSVADRLPEDDPDRLAMRIEPRSLLCTSAFRIGGSGAETGFNELRELCAAAGDQRSLAIGMGGWVLAENMKGHSRESSRIADELVQLLESIGDPTLTLALLPTAMIGKHDSAEMVEILRLAEQRDKAGRGRPHRRQPSYRVAAVGRDGVSWPRPRVSGCSRLDRRHPAGCGHGSFFFRSRICGVGLVCLYPDDPERARGGR